MPLASGARLGPFEIVSPLGAGGMGEVYRARDTRLGREVAIKILPDSVASDPDRRARFEREAQLDSGTLVYTPELRPAETVAEPIVWTNRAGPTTLLRSTPALWAGLRFAPDGQRLAMEIFDGKQTDIWIDDWARDALTRFTFDPTFDTNPVWTPDGRRLTFASGRAEGRVPNISWQRADGSGQPQRLISSPNEQRPYSWHPSGRFLAFGETHANTRPANQDLMILPIDGSEDTGWTPGTPTAFLNTPFQERDAMFSPDGLWVAYASMESGTPQVYVRRFPGAGGKWQVSTAGGGAPTWSRKTQELLFRSLDEQIMVAPYTVDGDTFRAERPRAWTEGRFPGLARGFAVHPDGQRVATPPIAQSDRAARRDQVVLIFNFFDEIKRAIAAK